MPFAIRRKPSVKHVKSKPKPVTWGNLEKVMGPREVQKLKEKKTVGSIVMGSRHVPVGATTLAEVLPSRMGGTTLEAVAEIVRPSPSTAGSDGCPPGKIRNPMTSRCVNIDGKIGQELLKSGTYERYAELDAYRAAKADQSLAECIEIPAGKWSGGARRKAPPFHSKPCAGQVKQGLNGKLWESRPHGSTWRWMPKK